MTQELISYLSFCASSSRLSTTISTSPPSALLLTVSLTSTSSVRRRTYTVRSPYDAAARRSSICAATMTTSCGGSPSSRAAPRNMCALLQECEMQRGQGRAWDERFVCVEEITAKDSIPRKIV
jgi:hypothetical protein